MSEALEYTLWALAKGLLFAFIVTFFIMYTKKWWHDKNRGNLYLNRLDALCDVENKIESFRLGILPLTPQQALQLFQERRFLNSFFNEYHNG